MRKINNFIQIIVHTAFIQFLSIFFCHAQIKSIGSRDTVSHSQQIYLNQYTTPLYAKNIDFFNGDSIKGKNQYAAVHTYLVKDFNGDAYSDIFLSFFTGGEIEKVPFKLLIYDTITGKYTDKSFLINNNTGQTFNRKSMAADINGDKIPDILCVSHPECNSCEYSTFDILYSNAKNNTWEQKTIKKANRFKGEGYFHGLAIGDVDNDGDNDVVLSNENTFGDGTKTLINDGKGSFLESNSMIFFKDCCSEFGVSWTNELADMNQDGFVDLLYWHDSTYRGIAYGNGTGKFGIKNEQRFPKSKYSLTMDYDPIDIDNDGDLDLIITTTDYSNGWEIVFLENKGNNENNIPIWFDRTMDINSKLKKDGFYKEPETINWVPYIHIADLNKDGFYDIIPQRPLSNGENPWIIYGNKNWEFSYTPMNIPEIPNKPKFKVTLDGKIEIKFPKVNIKHPRSSKRIMEWKIYYSNKYFGDKNLIAEKPIYVKSADSFSINDSVAYVLNNPYSKTYFRISTVDSSNLETPLSDIDSIICNIPKKPVTKNQNICLEQNSLGLKDFIISEHEILWYDSLTSKNGKKTPPSMPNSSGKFIYYVTTKDQCENGEKAILEINVFPIPSPPTIIKDTANHLITNVGGITWYKDGVKISDTTQKLKPTTNGLYSATTTQNGCISSISQTYFYLINFITNLSNGEYFRFYPNPTSGDVKIDYYLNASIELFIYINDFNGRSIISNQKIKSGNKINIGRVASGNYFAIVKDKEGRLITIQKVVKE